MKAFLFALLILDCNALQMMGALPEPVLPCLSGMGTTLVQTDWQLAETFVARDAEEAIRLAEEGRKLFAFVDSFPKRIIQCP